MLKNNVFLLLFLTLLVGSVNGRQRLIDESSNEALKSKYDSSTILVSTIDGYLTAIDVVSGSVKWRYNEGPVLKSPRSVHQDFFYIPNPQTGELYAIVDKHLNKLPFTIPQLVTLSPCKNSDGILYSGYKKDVWIAINPDSGVHQETVPPQNVNSCPVGQRPETVFIGRTEYKIDMSDTKKANRVWEATFVDYSSHLLPEDENYPFHHFHASSDGRLITFFNNSSKEILWNIDLKSVIVNMYLLKKDGMHRLPSTSVAATTFDTITIEQDVSAFISPNLNDDYIGTQSTSDNQKFLQTLFIGDTDFGYYAIRSFVDKKTDVFRLKSLGPLLMDGLEQSSNHDSNVLQPRIPEDIGLQVSVYQTTSGEFLLLGHHEMPPLLKKTPLDGVYFHGMDYSTYARQNKQRQRLLEDQTHHRLQIEGGKHEEENWEELLYKVWKKYPWIVIGFFGIIFVLSIVAVYFYGRYSVLFETRSITSGSQPPSHNPTNNSSRRIFEAADGSLHGAIHIGKLSYNTQNVIGKGCGGTKVFKGSFDGREVAIKRVLSDQSQVLTREVELLKRSDAHHNVVRYFCSENDETFCYIALELCDCSLEDLVRKEEIRGRFQVDPKELLRQATDGVSHLHSINIIHRDLKPQNILLSVTDRGQVRAKISDFGLCKQIKMDHMSVSKASGLFGTDGWIAPEVLRSDLNSVTFGVDVFSLGCIFYYVISGGSHPFGIDALNRQMSIRSGSYDLSYLAKTSDYVSMNVIEKMIEKNPKDRPSVHAVTNHPIFWSKDRQLQFFMDVSDRIEKEDENSNVMKHLEEEAHIVVKGSWINHICDALKADLCLHRSYLGHTVKDLLRAMRNKKHHYRELSTALQNSLGSIPDQFLVYFTDRFPRLLIHCYKVMALCGDESIFFTYYPEESKSFCGRMIQEQIASGFTIKTHSSPRIHVLKRQTVTSQSVPQIAQKNLAKQLPEFDPTKPPPNWRATAPPTISTQAPPGFDQQPQTVQTPDQAPKPRRRRRNKKTNAELFEVLSESVDAPDIEDEKDA